MKDEAKLDIYPSSFQIHPLPPPLALDFLRGYNPFVFGVL